MIQKLPLYTAPHSLEQAKSNITNLGRNMAEHAYLIGQNLIWVKSQLKHGEFLPWIEKNVWFGRMTATRFIQHTEKCEKEQSLLSYGKPNVTKCYISAKPAEIKQGQFRTVIIDPPWPYGTQYDKDTRRVASPYPEMTIEAITATGFPFADDCVLWLWTTHKFLPEAYGILQDWDFDYKATMVWNKEKMGIGYWLLNGLSTEQSAPVLFCLKLGRLFFLDKVRRKRVIGAEELAYQAAIRNRVVVRAAAGLGLFLLANLSRLIKKLVERASAPLLHKVRANKRTRSYD